MHSLDLLRQRLKTLGPSAEGLLPSLDALEDEFELRARRIAALSTASHITAILAGGDRRGEAVLDSVLMATLALADAERSLIVVADAGPVGYRVVKGRHRGGGAVDGLPADEAIRAALRGDSPLLRPALRPDASDDRLLVAIFRSAMATPISFGNRAIGCLYVELRGAQRSFTAADLETFRVFARHASVALGLALAHRDP